MASRCTSTRKPAASSVVTASSSAWLDTSGTCDCAGPFETLSVTVVPAGTLCPAAGFWATTVSAGWSDSTFVRTTLKPAPSSADAADS